MVNDLDALLDDGIDRVFFADMGEDVQIGDATKRVMFQYDVEVISNEGSIDRISTTILCKAGELCRNDAFTRQRDQRQWVVGRLLERSPDNRLTTYEVTPNA
ncbi:MAG: hypothetical protein ACPGUF_06900 [Litorivicinus sp.]